MAPPDYFKNLQNILLLILALLFIFPLPAKAQEASFYLSPSRGDYNIGRAFSVKVMVNTDGAAINASQATIYFPADKLAIQNVSLVIFFSDSERVVEGARHQRASCRNREE